MNYIQSVCPSVNMLVFFALLQYHLSSKSEHYQSYILDDIENTKIS